MGKQLETLHHIDSYIKDNGTPPTIKELASMCGLNSVSSIHYHLVKLYDNGLLQRDKNKPRGISITEKGKKLLRSEEVRG